MDEWFARADKLDTGDGRIACVSCHTVIPYALARPKLRRAMQVAAPTAQERRLVADTSRRVQTYGTHQLLYSFDEAKIGESQGTEAVLYAFVLAALDQGLAGREPSAAMRTALTRLWTLQRPDGSWEWLDVGLEPFEGVDSAYQGAALAALAVAMAPSLSHQVDAQRGAERLRNYLRTRYAGQNLHNRLWGLLASASLDGVLAPTDRDQLVAELGRRRNPDGGWSLDRLGEWRWNRTTPPYQSPGARDASRAERSDGYATGLVVYTLRQTGLSVEFPAVKEGLEWIAANQQPVRVGDRDWRAWRAHSLNYDREHGGARGEPWRQLFMSDAATAFSALALIGPD
jgi:squalene-hopene/tetraprenyl-beta-curcumene cyclase